MILFTYGPETYLVREKVNQVVAKALKQGVPESGVHRIDAAETPVGELKTALQSQGLFSDRQVVVIRDLLTGRSADEAEQIVGLLPDVPAETIAVFTEYGMPDRRRTAFKALAKAAEKTWEFDRLDDVAARRWVTDYAKSQGAAITGSAATKLVTDAGTDLWNLSSEIDKLSTAADRITDQTVAELVTPEITGDIFELVDSLGHRNATKAMRSLAALLAAGEPPLRILAMVVRQYRILLGVAALVEQGHPDNRIGHELSGSVGNLPPFVVRKAKGQAGLFTAAELRENFDRLADIDFDVKTGRRDAETSLELFVAESCQPSPARA